MVRGRPASQSGLRYMGDEVGDALNGQSSTLRSAPAMLDAPAFGSSATASANRRLLHYQARHVPGDRDVHPGLFSLTSIHDV